MAVLTSSAPGRGSLLGAARESSGLVARRWHLGARVVRVWQALRPFLATTAGLTCFVTAAFLWHLLAGIVVLGLSFLILDWYSGTDQARRR